MKIRRDDTVLVIVGKERGKKGKVHRVYPRENRLVVERVNLVKRHVRPRAMVRQTGIIEREAPLHISKVMLLCTKCSQPTRVALRFLADGRKVRVCKRCGEVID